MHKYVSHIAMHGVFALLHMAYICLIIIGSMKNEESSVDCTGSLLYPHTMIAVDGLFFFIYLLTIFLHLNKYFKVWNLKPQHTNFCPEIEHHNEVEEFARKLFTRQTNRYLCWYTFLVCLNLIKIMTN